MRIRSVQSTLSHLKSIPVFPATFTRFLMKHGLFPVLSMLNGFARNLMEIQILNVKMTNFQAESCAVTIFGKGPCQKVIKLHFYCHNFDILVQNQ